MFLCIECWEDDPCFVSQSGHNKSMGTCEGCGKTKVCLDCRPSHVQPVEQEPIDYDEQDRRAASEERIFNHRNER